MDEYVTQYKDKTVWFKGEEVNLTGWCFQINNTIFHYGVYLTGHKKGETVIVVDGIVEMQLYDVKEDNYNENQ